MALRISIAFAATLAFTGCGGGDERGAPSAERGAAERLLPPGPGFVLARVDQPLLAYSRPSGHGRPLARLRPRTPFGGPRVLAVVATRGRGRWLAVHSPVFGNGKLGWIRNERGALELSRTSISLRVDLSRKTIELRRGRRTARRIPIAIGKAGTATPAGRFQVTDKLPARRFPAGSYGCCIVALSARQPDLPEGWPGGDRIAIHGTPFDQTIGEAASNGCLRASDRDMRALLRNAPVGAPVFIRR